MNDVNAAFDPKALLDRLKLVFTAPKACWDTIEPENKSIKSLIVGYVLPLSVVGAVAGFLGSQVFGTFTPLGYFRPSFLGSLVFAVVMCILPSVQVVFGSFLLSKIAPQLGGKDDLTRAGNLLTNSMLPGLAGGILGLVPALSILTALLGLYNFYLFHQGSARMMSVPADKHIAFTVVGIVAMIIAGFVIGLATLPFIPLPVM